jgi:hypothetical protein
MLLGELVIFYLANFGDIFLTNKLVKWYGPEIEANARVRRMYETKDFIKARLALIFYGFCYVPFIAGLYYLPENFQLWIVGWGAVMPLIAILNLVRGALIFQKLKPR